MEYGCDVEMQCTSIVRRRVGIRSYMFDCTKFVYEKFALVGPSPIGRRPLKQKYRMIRKF